MDAIFGYGGGGVEGVWTEGYDGLLNGLREEERGFGRQNGKLANVVCASAAQSSEPVQHVVYTTHTHHRYVSTLDMEQGQGSSGVRRRWDWNQGPLEEACKEQCFPVLSVWYTYKVVQGDDYVLKKEKTR